MNILNEKTGEISYMMHEPGNKNSICGDHVISVLEDSYRNIWIGTWGDGLGRTLSKKRWLPLITPMAPFSKVVSTNGIQQVTE